MCGRRPAAARGPERCGRRFGLCPAPTGQHATPTESPRKNSTLRQQMESRGREGREEKREGRVRSEAETIRKARKKKHVLARYIETTFD